MVDQQRQRLARSSETEKPEHIRLAEEQGAAFLKAVEYMAEQEAESGGKTYVGDYLIAYAIEKAEGMYQAQDERLEWREPQPKENAHLEIVVCDRMTERFLPGLTVHARLVDSRGNEVGYHQQHFLWHPWLHHYGRNWHVPSDGNYTLQVHVEPPTFGRHDKVNGNRFSQPVEVEFPNVRIETGRKTS